MTSLSGRLGGGGGEHERAGKDGGGGGLCICIERI